MKTQEHKLNFRKDSLIELNSAQLNAVNGGTSSVMPNFQTTWCPTCWIDRIFA